MALTDDVSRRSFLVFGGVAIASGSILAACANNPETEGPPASTTPPDEGAGITTTTVQTLSTADLLILRTASSLEQVALSAYQQVSEKGLISSEQYGDAAALFEAHHEEHRSYLDALTLRGGAQPITEANATVMATLQPQINALGSQTAAVALLDGLESSIAASYRLYSEQAESADLRQQMMGIGAIESRHESFWLVAQGASAVPATFATTDGAVSVGTAIS